MNTPHLSSTVFIVDDDEAVRDSLRWLLEANGYRVRAYASGENFLDEYDASQIGVLIADVRMPGMSGPGTAGAADRPQRPRCPSCSSPATATCRWRCRP